MELLKQWLSAEHGRGSALARQLGVPASFVSKMAAGDKPVPVEHGAPIEAFTGGAVSRQQLFPKDWRRIWPELETAAANDEQAPDTTAQQPAGQGVALG
jgi:DNA-binding transcriptional regulator YdaS (Cro superfamily)